MANPLSELPQDFDTNFLSEQENFVKKEELGANSISSSFPTNNPWLVENFDEFLFYCCPECNYKCRLHNEFNSHALVSHPMAREVLVNDSENDKNLNTSPIHPAQAYNDINFDVQEQQNLSSPEENKKNNRPLFKKENNVVSEEIFSETPTELLEAISNDEPFGSSDEDLIDDPDSQIKDVDEDLYQVIGTKVGTLRFKCSVCSHKSRYKQGIIDHVKQVHRKERPYACTTCERSFFRKTDLRIHISNVHDGNRQFVCETCGHACSSKQVIY